jgi:hypothetical protein
MGMPVSERNTILDNYITGTYYVALWTTVPDDDGVGGVEVSGGGYARKAHSSWMAASNAIKKNNGDITFAEATGSWGTVIGVTLMTALTGGVQKLVNDSVINQVVGSGNVVEIPSGTDLLTAA